MRVNKISTAQRQNGSASDLFHLTMHTRLKLVAGAPVLWLSDFDVVCLLILALHGTRSPANLTLYAKAVPGHRHSKGVKLAQQRVAIHLILPAMCDFPSRRN